MYESLQTMVADKCHKDSFMPTRRTLQLYLHRCVLLRNSYCAILPQQTMATPIHKDPLCEFSKFLSCGHNKLWLPTSTNNLSDFSDVVSCAHNKQWLPKCCFLWPQQTIAAPIYKYLLCEFWIISESLSRIKQAKNAFKMSISRQLMSVYSRMIK